MSRTILIVGKAGVAQRREMTPEEEAERNAEEALPAPQPPPDPLAELLIEKGVITQEELEQRRAVTQQRVKPL